MDWALGKPSAVPSQRLPTALGKRIAHRPSIYARAFLSRRTEVLRPRQYISFHQAVPREGTGRQVANV